MKLPRYILLTVTSPNGVEVKIERKELVTCKDCIHSKDTDYQDTYFCTRRTHAQDFLVHGLDYCSYGERKEE